MRRTDLMLDSRHLRTSQYVDDRNLAKRIALHARFSTNPQSWFGWVFEHIAFPDRPRILEIGCGNGGFWVENQDRLPADLSLTITDLSAGMLDSARRRLMKVNPNALVADVQQLPFANAAFDIVIANHVLHHVPDIARAVTEICRVLRPGGSFYAGTNGIQNMREMFSLMAADREGAASARQVLNHFNLENGSTYLAASFPHVERRDFTNDLAITDVQAVIDYLESTQDEDLLTPALLAHARSVVEAEIAGNGVFRVRKSTGIFIAQRGLAPI